MCVCECFFILFHFYSSECKAHTIVLASDRFVLNWVGPKVLRVQANEQMGEVSAFYHYLKWCELVCFVSWSWILLWLLLINTCDAMRFNDDTLLLWRMASVYAKQTKNTIILLFLLHCERYCWLFHSKSCHEFLSVFLSRSLFFAVVSVQIDTVYPLICCQ